MALVYAMLGLIDQLDQRGLTMLGKTELLDAIAGKNRGVLATTADQQAIQAAIARLEERNPTPEPLASPDLLQGNWRLLYTTSQDLLRFEQIPLCRLGQIYQYILPDQQRIYNIAELYGLPLLSAVVSVAAVFQPVSKQRVQVQFDRSVVGFSGLLGYRSPEEFIQTLQSGKRLAALDIAIDTSNRDAWLDVTYLDGDLRIGRGNGGSLFVLTRV